MHGHDYHKYASVSALLWKSLLVHSGGSTGGWRRRATPPKGPDSFVLTYKFFET